MSLWKVNDEATQELMVSFYKHWLAGTSKRAAFLKAQKELKVKYPNPYYWGAFVLVGE
jgi:CHAT domain-containing protein